MKSKQRDQDVLFVAIKDPVPARKDILLATKDVLDVLKRYEEYKAVTAEKMQALAQLKRLVDELLVLNRKLRSKLPKPPIKLPELTSTAQAGKTGLRVAREKEEFTGPAPASARPKSKLDSLQEELEKIENRLSALE